MTQGLFFALTAVILFGISLYGFLIHRNLLHKILAANVMGSAVFLLLIALARYGADRGTQQSTADPVPHAMVLTGIVIAVSTTAFALALIRRLHRETGRLHLDETPSEPQR